MSASETLARRTSSPLVDVDSGNQKRSSSKSLIPAIAWRNLWRNRKRTWLTSGGIAFAVMLLVFAMSMQVGSYAVMIDNATGLLVGHIQVQQPDYQDDPALRHSISQARNTALDVAGVAGVVQVGLRASAFALISAGEKTFGAQVMGVEPEAERKLSTLPGMVEQGRYLESSEDAFLGTILARNLGVNVGDELVVLGSAQDGGVAALVLRVTGIYKSGQPELDRSVLQVELAAFQEAFGLSDEAHAVVVKSSGAYVAPEVAGRIRDRLGNKVRVLTWNELIPELEQAIELDRTSGRFMYFLLGLMVVFSVVNTFVMTVFERTREFGMLLSLGMRPRSVVLMLQLEALCYCVLGIAVGLTVASVLVFYLSEVGIPLGDSAEMLRAFHMPDRLYPALNLESSTSAPLVMLLATQLAALLPSLRVLRLKPVDALRT